MRTDWIKDLFVLTMTLVLWEGGIKVLAAPGEWNNTKWGMNPSEIKLLYPNLVINKEYKKDNETDLVLETKKNILKYEMDVLFFFKKNFLYQVLLKKDDYSSSLCVDFSIALSDAYGKETKVPSPFTVSNEEWYLPKGRINLHCYNAPFKRVGVVYRGKYIEPGL